MMSYLILQAMSSALQVHVFSVRIVKTTFTQFTVEANHFPVVISNLKQKYIQMCSIISCLCFSRFETRRSVLPLLRSRVQQAECLLVLRVRQHHHHHHHHSEGPS